LILEVALPTQAREIIRWRVARKPQPGIAGAIRIVRGRLWRDFLSAILDLAGD
jgi:hypothetical protein